MDTFCIGLDEFDTNIRTIWQNLQKEKEFCDMTLACEGKVIQTHKVIISAISPILRNILRLNTNKYPCIYLRGVKFKELENLLNFIYQGEVCIEEEDINSFLEVGKDLQIKGMASVQMHNSKSISSPMDSTKNLETVKIVFSDDLSMETAENIKIETEDTIMEPSTQIGQTESGSFVVDPSDNYSRPTKNKVWNSIKIGTGAVKKVKTEIRPIPNYAVKKIKSETTVDSAETEFRCEVCCKVYANVGSLNIHKRIHEGLTYPCERCGKEFTQRVNLTRHILAVHQGIRSQCGFCEKSFNDINALNKHTKIIHEGIRQQCEKCGKDFKEKSTLIKHRALAHNE